MKWSHFMAEAADKLGRRVDSAKRLKEQLEEAGFTDVVETRYKWPQNRWPKDQAYKELGKSTLHRREETTATIGSIWMVLNLILTILRDVDC
jgi:hypothetical protein